MSDDPQPSNDKVNLPPDSISSSELETCISVLNRLRDNDYWLTDPKYKGLRKAVMVERLGPRYFKGQPAEEYSDQLAVRRKIGLKNAGLKRDRESERVAVNQTEMRKQRLAALNSLLTEHGDTIGVKLRLEHHPESLSDELPSSLPEELMEMHETVKGVTQRQQRCYTCKKSFHQMHPHYSKLCPDCAELNWTKRNQRADLTGRVALVTGGRIKIGYLIVLQLLRCGARVVVTTRFSHDSVLRFSQEPDFGEWKDRLQVFGLDLRDLVAVERFAEFVRNHYSRLDIIINNAAQTVRRPPAFYKHLIAQETTALPPQIAGALGGQSFHSDKQQSASVPMLATVENDMSEEDSIQDAAMTTTTTSSSAPLASASALLSQIPLVEGDHIHNPREFPPNVLDMNRQQIDLRTTNSWKLRLDEVSTAEMVECQAVNAVAPFIINARLKPLMMATPGDKYIVNVSAMEGKFYRFKTPFHPHTNMAKAAMNMMTRTSAPDYAKDNIFMTSVDTGWVTDENPFMKAMETMETHNFQCPIDETDAMARVLDPVFRGVNNGDKLYGIFMKDYVETEW